MRNACGQCQKVRCTINPHLRRYSTGGFFVFLRFDFFSQGTGARRQSVSYSGREDYLNQTTYLLGSQSAVNPIEMQPGVTTYSFACVLPMQLPSSFEGKHGNIRYSCKAVLDRPWKTDKEFRLSFTVIKTEDLNLLSSSFLVPSKSEIVRHFYCCCFKSKPFFMSASIPFTGYVPGQNIEVTIKINNQSNVDVEGTKIALERNTQYICQTPRKKIKQESLSVKEVFGAGVSASGSTEIKLVLAVPPLAPTNLNFCRVLKTCYQLKVLAKVTGAHKSPHVNIPITIGTIPFRPQAPQYDAIMNSSIASSSSHPSAPPAFDLPPPSYEAATRIVPEMTENDANVSFFDPCYPVWNFNPQPTAMPMPSATHKMPLK